MQHSGDPAARPAVTAIIAAALIGAALWFAVAPAGADERSGKEVTGVSSEVDEPVGDDATAAHRDRPADLFSAVKQDARHFGWPVVLAVLVGLFLFLQGQVDRQEPKLADAPLDQGERLRFRS